MCTRNLCHAFSVCYSFAMVYDTQFLDLQSKAECFIVDVFVQIYATIAYRLILIQKSFTKIILFAYNIFYTEPIGYNYHRKYICLIFKLTRTIIHIYVSPFRHSFCPYHAHDVFELILFVYVCIRPREMSKQRNRGRRPSTSPLALCSVAKLVEISNFTFFSTRRMRDECDGVVELRGSLSAVDVSAMVSALMRDKRGRLTSYDSSS